MKTAAATGCFAPASIRRARRTFLPGICTESSGEPAFQLFGCTSYCEKIQTRTSRPFRLDAFEIGPCELLAAHIEPKLRCGGSILGSGQGQGDPAHRIHVN